MSVKYSPKRTKDGSALARRSANPFTGSMTAIVFDIDGTLLRSNHVDDEAFVLAMDEVLGITGINRDWTAYGDSTDPGLTAAICLHHLKRPVERGEEQAIKLAYERHLRELLMKSPGAITPTVGAIELLRRLSATKRVAIATGSWSHLARLKLGHAGVPVAGVPLASADLASQRADIIRWALRMGRLEGLPAVYVGDAVWDFEASRKLGIGFIGVGGSGKDDRLIAAGVRDMVLDFSDAKEFLKLVESVAAVPAQ